MGNKTLMERIEQGRQYRSMQFSTRTKENETEESFIVEGYATTFDDPYTLYEDDEFRLIEKVDSQAFSDCDMSDVIFQYDHCGRVYARGSNGTLECTPDEHGLLIRADLSKSDESKKLYQEIKAGLTTKMSFGFTVTDAEELRTEGEDGKDEYIRTIKKIGKLYDVSAVSLPANDGTEISARSLVDGLKELRSAELTEQQKIEEEKRQKELEEQKIKAEKERERLALEIELALSL